MRFLIAFATFTLLGCASLDPAFTCSSDAQCQLGGQAGTCEREMHVCSVADPACAPSGRRYGPSAGGGMAGTCVAAQAVDAGVDAVAQISAGHFHTCARYVSGKVACWGKNAEGQIGDGLAPAVEPFAGVPRFVVGLADTGAEQISCGEADNCALMKDGKVQCWGANDEAQLGVGDADDHLGGTTVIGVGGSPATRGLEAAGGDAFNCAILASGKASCWGSNAYGRLGSGSAPTALARSPIPTEVVGLADAVAMSAGESHACAVRANGTVLCWGNNDFDQLGLGELDGGQPAFSATPVPVAGITDARAIELGEKHSCAYTAANEIWCWGSNSKGQLGDNGASGAMSPTPVKVVGLTVPKEVSGAGEHTCARTENGAVFCWGDNGFGQGGQDPATVAQSPVPVKVAGLPGGASSVTVGNEHSCAMLISGDVYCWGHNDLGELGDQLHEAQSATVVKVQGLK